MEQGEQRHGMTQGGPCDQHTNHGHVHNLACGHETRRHGDHEDYEHEGHWHAKHGDHWDEHETA